MYNDRIDLTLPEANLEQIVSFLLSAEELLSALKSVTPTDRKHLAKLGLKNETLARDIIEVGRANLDLIPRGIDFEKIDRDLIARDQLRSLKFLLERLLGRVKDSLLLTGVDIYAAALAIYHSLRRNGERASLKEVVDELKKGFARPSRKKKGEEENAEAEIKNTAPKPMVEPAPLQLRPDSEESPSPGASDPKAIEQSPALAKSPRPLGVYCTFFDLNQTHALRLAPSAPADPLNNQRSQPIHISIPAEVNLPQGNQLSLAPLWPKFSASERLLE